MTIPEELGYIETFHCAKPSTARQPGYGFLNFSTETLWMVHRTIVEAWHIKVNILLKVLDSSYLLPCNRW